MCFLIFEFVCGLLEVKSRSSAEVSTLSLKCLFQERLSVFYLPLLDAAFLLLLSELFLLFLLLLLYLLLLLLEYLPLLLLPLDQFLIRHALLLTDLFMLGSVFLAPALDHLEILFVVQVLLIVLGPGPVAITFWLTLFLTHIEL